MRFRALTEQRKWGFMALCFSLLWCGLTLPALSANAGAVQAEVHADTVDYDENLGVVRLLGNVCLTYGELTVHAAVAQYDTKSQEANFRGQIKAVYQDNVLTGEQMNAKLRQSLIVTSGKARLQAQRALGKNMPVTVLQADAIEYNWAEHTAQARGQIYVEQAQRKAYADHAVYDEQTQIITLSGSVRFEQGKDEWIMSERVKFDLAAHKLSAEGRVSGRFVIGAGSLGKEATQTKQAGQLPEAEPIEPMPASSTVDEVDTLILPGLEAETK